MSATFLATGFEPFGEHRTNSSWDALERPRDVVTLRVPVDHRAARAALRRAQGELEPTAVLCTGLAKGRPFRIESCARLPAQLSDVAPSGEPALVHGRWRWDETRRALEPSGVDVVESEDAGRRCLTPSIRADGHLCARHFLDMGRNPARTSDRSGSLFPRVREHRLVAVDGLTIDARARAAAAAVRRLSARSARVERRLDRTHRRCGAWSGARRAALRLDGGEHSGLDARERSGLARR
jgi:hypothetical protein